MTARAAIFTRADSRKQDGGHAGALAEQEARCRRYCQEQGFAVVAVIDEVGAAGRIENRPRLDQLRAAMQRREIDVVVATKLDRIIRGLCGPADFAAEADRAGVELHLLDGPSHQDLLASIAAAERRYYEKPGRGAPGCAVDDAP